MNNTKRNLRRVFLFLAGGLLVAAAVVVFGWNPLPRSRDSARPPCNQLPDRAMVAQALEAHGDLAARMEAIGPGVNVEIVAPCADQPDRAILRIWYRTEAEWQRVDALLTTEDGFGVDVEVKGW